MEILVQDNADQMGKVAARLVARVMNAKPDAVLGLGTGATLVGLYKELVRMHRDEGLDFSQVTTFNLDEYVGLTKDHGQSYHYFMHEHFFKFINIPKQNIHIPSGTTENYAAFCQWYESRIAESGGIDVQVMGIGADGHIAFNEPGSSLGSRTRIKTLSKQTVEENSRFFDSIEEVPIYAITMGVGTIMESRKLILLANGPKKADAVAAAVEGPITSMITASALQMHPNAVCVLDEPAAGRLKMLDYYKWIQEKMPDAP